MKACDFYPRILRYNVKCQHISQDMFIKPFLSPIHMSQEWLTEWISNSYADARQ